MVLVLVVGCRRPAEVAVEEPPRGAVLAQVDAELHPDLPVVELTFLGSDSTSGAEVASIEAIELRHAGGEEPVQILEVEAAELPASTLERLVLIEDMNFDGYKDLRLPELLPSGPNVPYLHWLFDPETGRFERAPWLDELSGAVFDAETGRIRTQWRDGATSYGTEIYEMVDDRPVLVRREVREYVEEGVYRLVVSERSAAEMVVIETRTVKEE